MSYAQVILIFLMPFNISLIICKKAGEKFELANTKAHAMISSIAATNAYSFVNSTYHTVTSSKQVGYISTLINHALEVAKSAYSDFNAGRENVHKA